MEMYKNCSDLVNYLRFAAINLKHTQSAQYNAHEADGIYVSSSVVLLLQCDGEEREQRN